MVSLQDFFAFPTGTVNFRLHLFVPQQIFIRSPLQLVSFESLTESFRVNFLAGG